jgi:DNA-nicking Smr family endonuclease
MTKPPPPSEPSEPSGDDEARAFELAVAGARRLEGGPRRVIGPPASPSRKSASRALRVPTAPGTGAQFEIETLGDGVAGRAAGVSAAVLRALRRGEHPPEARLDLHGLTRDEAVSAAEQFLLRSRARGRRTVLVIHGRGQNSEAGGPVLRPALQEWLGSAASARAGVMAFAPAPPRAGGAGATLVLLRR